MTPAVLVAVAAAATAAVVLVVVGPDRLAWIRATDVRHSPAHRRGPRWLSPLPGAPGVGVRVLAGAAVGLVLAVVGPLPGVPGVIAAIVGAAGVYVAAGRLRPAGDAAARRELASALPVICTQLAVCLEAGLPLRNAVAVLGEHLGGEPARVLRRVDAAVRLGVPEDQVWAELGAQHPELAGLARALRHASCGGVALAGALRQHADEARAAVRSAAESRARRAGVSIVLPLAVCFLPAFLLVGVVPIVGGVLGRLLG
ncbi:MAG: type II secretion system F family protein [Micropruina sp.]